MKERKLWIATTLAIALLTGACGIVPEVSSEAADEAIEEITLIAEAVELFYEANGHYPIESRELDLQERLTELGLPPNSSPPQPIPSCAMSTQAVHQSRRCNRACFALRPQRSQWKI